MDFLSVGDSGDWGDWADAKDLHTQLFIPQNVHSKKLKATRKTQAIVTKTQDGNKAIKKQKNNHTPEKLQHVSPQMKKDEKMKKPKKKRKRIDASRVPLKKRKLRVSSGSSKERKPNLEHTSQQNDNSETSTNVATINPSQKKRKRKPRNNKFKTAEFGYSVPPSETGKSNKEPKISLPAQPEKLKIKKSAKKIPERAKDSDKNATAKEENSNKRTKFRNKKDPRKKKGVRDSLHSPRQNMKKKISENLDKNVAVKEDFTSNRRTKLRTTFEMGNNNKISANELKRSKERSVQVDKRHTPDSSATECEKTEVTGPAVSVVRDEDITSDSEEPQPDLSAKQALKSKMEAKLKSAHFRYLNEQLYKTTGTQAHQMMAQDKEAFNIYHHGFSQQVRQWPINPVDKFIEDLKTRPATLTVGDFGCGEARIAQNVNQTVHSFDLCALNEHVKVCDMEKVPLKNNSLDVAIFCLSLMGTNWINYIKEANRVLKMNGQLKIAEVTSRFTMVADFLKTMKQLGFKKKAMDFSKMFLMFDFVKEAPSKKVELERGEVLRPCLYKRR